jgi:hypothetical protein
LGAGTFSPVNLPVDNLGVTHCGIMDQKTVKW